jgi:hypothetical protein
LETLLHQLAVAGLVMTAVGLTNMSTLNVVGFVHPFAAKVYT